MSSDDHKPVNRSTHTITVSKTGFNPIGANARQGDTISFTSSETVATLDISFANGLFLCSNPFAVAPLDTVSQTVLPGEGDYTINVTKKDDLPDPTLSKRGEHDSMTGSIKVGGGTDPR